MVLQARSENPGEATKALHQLCELYHVAIHAWFRRCLPTWLPENRAADWAQDFLVFMQEKNPFRRIEHRESRFRSFLVTCLKHFLRDKMTAENAAKRGGGVVHEEWREEQIAGDGLALHEALDQEFAANLHERVLTRLAEIWRRKGQFNRFQLLQPHLLGLTPGASYEELAKAMGTNANHVKKIVFDMRGAYYDCFSEEVKQVVQDPKTLDDEMRYLAGLLARGASQNL